jgi:hypothetical protein
MSNGERERERERERGGGRGRENVGGIRQREFRREGNVGIT